jgi:hypothetical protein
VFHLHGRDTCEEGDEAPRIQSQAAAESRKTKSEDMESAPGGSSAVTKPIDLAKSLAEFNAQLSHAAHLQEV